MIQRVAADNAAEGIMSFWPHENMIQTSELAAEHVSR